MIPKLLVTAALMAAQVAIGMTRKTQGPRLDTLKTTTAEYGTPIPRFWGKRKFECPLIWAEDLREEKKTSKGKAGKNTQYKYYASFALLICDHEIEAVTRIWMDDKLVYDVTGTGPTSVASLVHLNSRNMRVYLGTEDQDADPRMEAWCEDRYGPDSCPAYRGSAYVVFEDLPVNNFGNRIPNCTIEAVSAKVDAFPMETRETTQAPGQSTFAFSPGSTWMAYYNQALSLGLEWWDAPSRQLIGIGGSADPLAGSVGEVSLGPNGTAYFAGADLDGESYAYSTAPLAAVTKTLIAGGPLGIFNCTRALGLAPTVYSAYDNGAGYVAAGVYVDDAQSARDFCVDDDGDHWALLQPMGASSSFTLKNLSSGGSTTLTGTARTAPTSARLCFSEAGNFFVETDGKFYIIPKATMTIAASGDAVRISSPVRLPGQTVAASFWDNFDEYSLADGSLIRSLDKADWGIISSGPAVYDPINHALWSREGSGDTIFIAYLGRVSAAGVPLKTIVDDVSEWCGLTGQDTLALTQTVLGYSVTQGSGKDMLAPLLDMHDVDARPHGFSVEFLNRGGAPSGTIATSDFVRDGDQARYTVTIQQDTDLPREISIKFADNDHDQQINTAIAQRPLDTSDSSRTDSVDLSTMVDTADGAQRKVERFFRRIWNSRERIKLSLTAQHLALEPGDVTTPSLDGLPRNARLDKLTIRGSVLDCEFVRDETSFATLSSSTGAPIEGNDVDVIVIPAPTKGFALDIPLAQDADVDINPLIYIAAGSYAGAWPGALAYENDELVASIDSDAKATWGVATSTLGTANPWLWDRGNTVDVTVFGTLVSSTEAAIDADPTVNLCAFGADGRWELFNFATATLTGTSGAGNTYTLSGLKRGRRGTEGSVGNHASGDSLVMLTMAHIVEFGAGDVGTALSFKIQTIGRDPDSVPVIDLTFTGATLKPRAPVIWHTIEEDNGDLTIQLRSRTRVGGNWNGSAIPTGETIESYAFDVMDGDTVVRTLTSSTKTLTYSSADRAIDGLTTLEGNAYQLSATVGRGFARAA